MNSYIVTTDNPYYPSIQYFSSLEDAMKCAAVEVKDRNTVNGEYDVNVTVAEVKQWIRIKTDY